MREEAAIDLPAFDEVEFERRSLQCWRDWKGGELMAACAEGLTGTPADRPAVAYWSGICSFMHERADALAWLDVAHAGCSADGAALPLRLRAAAAGVVVCVLDVSAQRDVASWCERAREFDRLPPGTPAAQAGLWRHLARVCAGLLSDQDTPDMQASAQWLHTELGPLRTALNRHERLIAAQVLLNYHLASQQYDRFDSLRVNVEHPALFDEAAPLLRARWLYTYGFVKYHAGESDDAEPYWVRAAAVSQQHSLSVTALVTALAQLRLEVDRGNLVQATAIEATIDDRSGAGRESQLALLHQMRARLKMLEQLPGIAKTLLDQAIATAMGAGATKTECAAYDADMVQVLIALERIEEASMRAASLTEVHHGRNGEIFRCLHLLIEAWRLRTEDLQGSRRALSAGLRLVQQLNFRMFFRLQPGFAAGLCALALSWNIERVFVLEIIGRRKLAAPPNADHHWPWRFWEQMLGSTESRIDGKRQTAGSTRMPSKPVELHRLLCCQTDMSMPMMRAAAALWPDDAEGDTDRTFELRRKVEENIARLRTRLGAHATVEVSEGVVRLNAACSNSDVRSRRLLIHQLQVMALRTAGLPPGAVLHGIAEATTLIISIRELSGGTLMPGVEGVAWVNDQRSECERDGSFKCEVQRLG
ncbi:hypothetical protein [Ideonella sp. A 288]|uniref:hypothetical protein n=1 Tax=Ideonella sp. A 288 TaxID=1962181 RepID=UPI000B4A8D76|nr:hypothetical protein [Ideonella sp. A 288]